MRLSNISSSQKRRCKMKVLVVGQTPPPWGGQAVMIQQLLNADFSSIHFYHVRMAFSEDMDKIGRFKIHKLWHLCLVVVRIYMAWFNFRPSILYYPPAGPNRIPFYRDVVILILTRWLFQKTIFHFHASGISALYPSLSRFEKWLFNQAYRNPHTCIRVSSTSLNDSLFFNAKNDCVVHYGIPELSFSFTTEINTRNLNSVPRILFVGALYESKGVQVLIDACKLLHDEGNNFELLCVGRFQDNHYENITKSIVEQYGLSNKITFAGVLTGDAKWKAYATSDIFCFPSFFESEAFPVVNLEAMQFQLPIVSTNWRGIPEAVHHGVNGFLTDIKNPQQTSEKLSVLLRDKDLRLKMGRAGRTLFLERFSDKVWYEKMRIVFEQVNSN